jgi:hypothetical protein
MLRKARKYFSESLDQDTLADCAAGLWFTPIDKSAPKASKRRANA